MEKILIIIAAIMAAQTIINLYFNITARKINEKRYNENKETDDKTKEFDNQLTLMNTTILNVTNELAKWKNVAFKLDAMVKEKDAEIESLKAKELGKEREEIQPIRTIFCADEKHQTEQIHGELD